MVVMAARGRDSFSAPQLRALESAANLTVHAVPGRLARDEMQSLCAPAEILGFTRRAMPDFDAQLIGHLPNLRALSVYATGSDWLDLQALERRGIRLALLPDYSTQSVAEHTLGLMLGMSRRLHLSDRVARGDLPHGVSLRGFELSGKTLGIFRLRAYRPGHRAHGARLQYACAGARHRPQALRAGRGNGRAAPIAGGIRPGGAGLQPGARRAPLINGAALAAMKPGALLINPSRSALVDNAAVLQAIIERRLRGYAVDDTVFDAAQLARIEHGRILQSAHTAWYSDEAMARGTQAWVEALVSLAASHRALRADAVQEAGA